MATFNDTEGRSYVLVFDGIMLEEIRGETDIDLGDLAGEGLLTINRYPARLVRVLACAVKDQLKPKGLSDRQFARAMNGDAQAEALAALMEGLADFFPTALWSKVQRRLTAALQREEQLADMAPQLAMLGALPDEIRKEVTDEMRGMIREAIATQGSPRGEDKLKSAIGPDDTPASIAIGGQASAGSPPEA